MEQIEPNHIRFRVAKYNSDKRQQKHHQAKIQAILQTLLAAIST
jgi:hypothetical protein